MNYLLFIISLFLLSVSGVFCLKLLSLSVPHVGNFNEDAVLQCDFDLERDSLYSVKWYKDDFEFYRYMPDNTPSTQAIPVTGVHVDEVQSNYNRIVLKDLNFNSTGTYKCEVSTEGPNFATIVENGHMTIMALPRDDPMIEGILTTYLVGDYVSGTCVSQKSRPPPILTWYINDVKVDASYLVHPATDETDSNGLHTRTLAIRFKVDADHFGKTTKAMVLRCTATVEKMSWHKSVYSVLGPVISKKMKPERLSNGGFTSSKSVSASGVIILTTLSLLSLS